MMMMMLKRVKERSIVPPRRDLRFRRPTHLIQCHVLSADCPYCEKGQQTESLRRRPRLSTIGRTLLSSSSAVAMLITIGTDSERASVPLVVVSAATSSHNSLF